MFCFAKILNYFSTPLHSKKNKIHFCKCLKTVLKFEGEEVENDLHFQNFTVFSDFLHFCTVFKT